MALTYQANPDGTHALHVHEYDDPYTPWGFSEADEATALRNIQDMIILLERARTWITNPGDR